MNLTHSRQGKGNPTFFDIFDMLQCQIVGRYVGCHRQKKFTRCVHVIMS